MVLGSDGARGLSQAPPATKVVGRMGPLHPLLHLMLLLGGREGGGQVRREEAAESSKSSLGQPWPVLPPWIVLF